jgi:integrase
MTAAVSQATLAALVESQQRTAEQLAVLTTELGQRLPSAKRASLTVAEFVPQVQASVPKERTRDTYSTTWRRMVEVAPCWYPDATGAPRDPSLCAEHGCLHSPGGGLRLDEYRTVRIQQLGMWVLRREQEAERLRIARRRLLVVRATDPEVQLDDILVTDDDLPVACGNAGLRTYVVANRYFWGQARKAGEIADDPMGDLASELSRPRNLLAGTRPLSDRELAHLEQVVQLSGWDSDLDLLLVWFHLETGARMSEAIKLNVEDLDPDRQTIRLGKKGDSEREQPVSASLIEALVAHAVSRGADYDHDRVFRTSYGNQFSLLCEAHYTHLWKRVRQHADWAARAATTTHALRKTTATRLERMTSEFVAEAFLGHQRGSDSNAPYMRVDLDELALAIEVLTGEHHPLARPTPTGFPSATCDRCQHERRRRPIHGGSRARGASFGLVAAAGCRHGRGAHRRSDGHHRHAIHRPARGLRRRRAVAVARGRPRRARRHPRRRPDRGPHHHRHPVNFQAPDREDPRPSHPHHDLGVARVPCHPPSRKQPCGVRRPQLGRQQGLCTAAAQSAGYHGGPHERQPRVRAGGLASLLTITTLDRCGSSRGKPRSVSA